MSHTLKVMAAGFVLLAVCLLLARWWDPTEGFVLGAKIFLPLWLLGALVNMWFGVWKAGYSVKEEAPIFLLVFAVPAAVAGVVWLVAARR